MKLLLHIGTTKTGTTSCQRFLDRNDLVLEELGIHVMRTLGRPNHRAAAVLATAIDATPDLHTLEGLRSEDEKREYESNITALLEEELRASAADVAVISNEHLHSRVHDAAAFDRLRHLITDHFDSFSVLCYLRPSLDHALSLYSTLVTKRTTMSVDEFFARRISNPDHYFDFEKFLRPWVQFAGSRSAVDVRLFDDFAKDEYGILLDFTRRLGVDLRDSRFDVPSRANQSISAAGQQLLLVRNRIPQTVRARYPRVERAFNAWIRSEFKGPGAVPALEIAERFHDTFAPSTDYVRRTFFPNREEILEPNWAKITQACSDANEVILTDSQVHELFRSSPRQFKAAMLRDHALAVEQTDLVGAQRVMKLASRIYPEGSTIRKFLAQSNT
jgi:hypothetical protein